MLHNAKTGTVVLWMTEDPPPSINTTNKNYTAILSIALVFTKYGGDHNLYTIVYCTNGKRKQVTLMATGYTVAPISKLPFLNIITDVLLMQVPGGQNSWSQGFGI